MRFAARVVLVVLAAANAVLAFPTRVAVAARQADFTDPNDDPFYQLPPNIAKAARGQVIKSRQVTTDIGTTNNAASYQIQYRTTNTSQMADANVATIWIPAEPVSPPKIFVYSVYEDSTQLDCAPSYNFLTGLFDRPNKPPVALDTAIVISWALMKGYYVVSADAYGSGSSFIAGYQEGMSTLDAIRALRNYANLPTNSPTGAYGYSGGASTTVWTETLAASYAPEINFIGTAHGGTPVSVRYTFDFLNGGPSAGFALLGVSGLSLAYPAMEAFIQPRLNPQGVKKLTQIRSRGFCLAGVISQFPFLDVFSLVNDTNLLNQEPISSILKKESLIQSEASWHVPTPKFPRFIWHALEDDIVPYEAAQEYVQDQCSKGANIQFSTFPLAQHISAELLGVVPGLFFLDQAYAGQTPTVKCGSGSLIPPPSAQQVLGNELADQLLNLKGKTSAFGDTFSFSLQI